MWRLWVVWCVVWAAILVVRALRSADAARERYISSCTNEYGNAAVNKCVETGFEIQGWEIHNNLVYAGFLFLLLAFIVPASGWVCWRTWHWVISGFRSVN